MPARDPAGALPRKSLTSQKQLLAGCRGPQPSGAGTVCPRPHRGSPAAPPPTGLLSKAFLRIWRTCSWISSLGSTGWKATFTRHLCGDRACWCLPSAPGTAGAEPTLLVRTPILPRDFSLPCPFQEGLPDHSLCPGSWGGLLCVITKPTLPGGVWGSGDGGRGGTRTPPAAQETPARKTTPFSDVDVWGRAPAP